MPQADEFVAGCAFLAGYDLKQSLQQLVVRHAAFDPTELCDETEAGRQRVLRNHENFAELLGMLVAQSATTLEQTNLKAAIRMMLSFDYARAGDTDIGWYALNGGSPRAQHAAWLEFIASPEADDPAEVRRFVNRLYRR